MIAKQAWWFGGDGENGHHLAVGWVTVNSSWWLSRDEGGYPHFYIQFVSATVNKYRKFELWIDCGDMHPDDKISLIGGLTIMTSKH